MKKLLLIGFTKFMYMPYMNFYLDTLHSSPIEIHVIKWSRDHEPDISLGYDDIVVHDFKCVQLDETLKLGKIPSFLKFRSFVRKVLYDHCFDKIIVMHSLPAVLIVDSLLKDYADRFIFDYRDYTYENFLLFKKAIEKLTMASYATFVSSDAFRKVLPKLDKIYTSHNLLIDSLEHRCEAKEINLMKPPVRIAFWGLIRQERINRALIESLGNDSRFELHYYGREQATALALKELVAKKKLNNVFFHGSYQPSDRYVFATQTDIIHNLYENDKGMQKAMSNKYYDAIIFRIPQICNIGSYMGNKVEVEGVGCTLDPFECGFANQLAQYCQEYNRSLFEKNCDKACEKVVDEFLKGQHIIKQFTE